MSLLLNWITTYGNWAQYKDSHFIKNHTTEGIVDYLAENGIYGRDVKNVQGKMSKLEKQFNEAAQWLGGTGQDIVINKKCRYYYQVEHVLGTCDKATWLDAANSADPKSAEASLDSLRLSSKEIEPTQVDGIPMANPTVQNDDEHSQGSIHKYHCQATKSIVLDNNFNISNDDI
ncbi:hypothetical protein DFH28DRAFT_934835 [Melampsora americana]|nr:hypothetical protein DFH28DRAFT_934835 [Melampsora americana]